jgi:MFS family permease
VSEADQTFYGWYIVGACFVICFFVFGISVNTFTVYVKPLEAEFGWSRKLISAAISIGALSMAFSAPFIGRLIDRLGARRIMLLGATTVGGASILLSQMHSLPFYYAVFVVSGVGQAAATVIPISLVVSNWFTAKRGLAMGIVMSGTGLGAMVMVPVTTWIVARWGWRTSTLVMGLIIIGVAVPANLLFIRTKPSEMGLSADGTAVGDQPGGAGVPIGLTVGAAARTRSFWMIAAIMFIFGHVGLGIGVHMMAYLSEVGYSEATASMIIAVISAMTVGGKVGMGFLVDRWGLRWAVVLTCVLVATGIILLMSAQPLSVALVFAAIYGFAIGAPLVFNPTLTAQYLGLAHFGAIFGILNLVGTIGAALGPVVSGAIYDTSKSYVPAYIFFLALIAIAALCGFAARPEVKPRSLP